MDAQYWIDKARDRYDEAENLSSEELYLSIGPMLLKQANVAALIAQAIATGEQTAELCKLRLVLEQHFDCYFEEHPADTAYQAETCPTCLNSIRRCICMEPGL